MPSKRSHRSGCLAAILTVILGLAFTTHYWPHAISSVSGHRSATPHQHQDQQKRQFEPTSKCAAVSTSTVTLLVKSTVYVTDPKPITTTSNIRNPAAATTIHSSASKLPNADTAFPVVVSTSAKHDTSTKYGTSVMTPGNSNASAPATSFGTISKDFIPTKQGSTVRPIPGSSTSKVQSTSSVSLSGVSFSTSQTTSTSDVSKISTSTYQASTTKTVFKTSTPTNPATTVTVASNPTKPTNAVNSTVPWVQPPSLQYIQANGNDSTGQTLLPIEVYDDVQKFIALEGNNPAVVVNHSTEYCAPLPDDPCIYFLEAMKNHFILKQLEDSIRNKSDHNGDHEDDDKKHEVIETVKTALAHFFGTVIPSPGGGAVIAYSAMRIMSWNIDHDLKWKFGEFLSQRSRPLFELFKSRLPPAEIIEFGLKTPLPPLPPVPAGLPFPPVPPPTGPSPPHGPPGNSGGESENGQEQDQEDPDDDDCPPKLQKAQAEIQQKEKEIAKLKQDLKHAEEQKKKVEDEKKKTEDDLDSCEDEVKKLHEAQEELRKIRSRDAAGKLRKANEELKEKQGLVDSLVSQVSTAGGNNAELEAKLKQAQDDLKKASDKQQETLQLAEAATKLAKEAQEKVNMFADMNVCYQKSLEDAQTDVSTCEKQLEAFRRILLRTEDRLQDADNRASTAEGTRSANEDLIKQLQQENTEMTKHTCPVNVLTQPTTCQHTNEEIARMKLTYEACNYDRSRLRKPDPKPEIGEEDLPVIDQLDRYKRRFANVLAQKASIANEYTTMTKFAKMEVERLKSDLADCRKQLNGGIDPSANTQQCSTKQCLEDTSVKSRISKLESDIAQCNKQKAEAQAQADKCPVSQTDGPRDAKCQKVLDEVDADARECYSQCECPPGVVYGPHHMRRSLVAREWFELEMGVNGTEVVAAPAA